MCCTLSFVTASSSVVIPGTSIVATVLSANGASPSPSSIVFPPAPPSSSVTTRPVLPSLSAPTVVRSTPHVVTASSASPSVPAAFTTPSSVPLADLSALVASLVGAPISAVGTVAPALGVPAVSAPSNGGYMYYSWVEHVYV